MEQGFVVAAASLAFLAAGLALGLAGRRAAARAAAATARAEIEGELAVARARAAGLEGQGVELRDRLAEAAARARADAARLAALTGERERLAADLAAERRAATERAGEAERAREGVRAELQALAGRLLDEKGQVMLERSREGLEALLRPLGEKLRDFEAKVEKTYDQENRDRASLLGSLERLQEAQARLHADAEGLARALTGDSRSQGDWGELVLERVLETAGLTAGREYELQVDHRDEEGAHRRPDALVYLPGDRAIVVDAKCSLTAFVESTRETDPARREAALDRHVASVRAHVKGLAAKGYLEVLAQRTLDVVFLFVPNEAAFHAAVARDPGLYGDALRERIVLCSPTTLLAALRIVSQVWRSEKQNQNAQRIADEAGKLLDKLAAFALDLDEAGARLGRAQESLSAAREKLSSGRGNVLRRAAQIARLGAPVKKERVRELLLRAGAGDDDGDGDGEDDAAGAAEVRGPTVLLAEPTPRDPPQA